MASEVSRVKSFMQNPEVQKRIKETLGAKSTNFTASVLSLIGSDELLATAEPQSLFTAALTAASLDLPINKNLGFAHIVGYKNNKKGIVEAQFQIGWKGFVQLAQRSGQYKRIASTEVYDGQLTASDPLGGNTYDWNAKKSDRVIGYVSRFTLVTGFESELYMSVDEVMAHGKRYSQAFKSGFGPWKDNFDAMALKTVTKLNISKYGPMSTELEKAVTVDQAVIDDKGDIEYIDGEVAGDVGQSTIEEINTATTTEEMAEVLDNLDVETRKAAAPYVKARLDELKTKAK